MCICMYMYVHRYIYLHMSTQIDDRYILEHRRRYVLGTEYIYVYIYSVYIYIYCKLFKLMPGVG